MVVYYIWIYETLFEIFEQHAQNKKSSLSFGYMKHRSSHSNDTAQNKSHSVSLVRGLAILSSFSEQYPLLGVTELAAKSQLNKSTTHRYVDTLKTLGYLEQDARTRKYRLGIGVVDLGLAALGGMELRQIALPYLEDLAAEFGHTVNMSVLDGDAIIIVERIPTRKRLDIHLHVGSRLPAYCTSMGKVLLAYLPQQQLKSILNQTTLEARGPNTITDKKELLRELHSICEKGFAITNEELGVGLRAVAVPVRSSKDDVVAAINMSVYNAIVSSSEMASVLAPRVVATATEISRKLGYREALANNSFRDNQ